MKIANHQLALGSTVHLSEMPTQGRLYHDDRVSAEAEFRKLREELIDWQDGVANMVDELSAIEPYEGYREFAAMAEDIFGTEQ